MFDNIEHTIYIQGQEPTYETLSSKRKKFDVPLKYSNFPEIFLLISMFWVTLRCWFEGFGVKV